MQQVIPLKRSKIDYSRKHDLTEEEIRESPIFQSLTDPEIQDVRAIYLEMCQMLLEFVENQDNELGLGVYKSHIASRQLIELEQFKSKAA